MKAQLALFIILSTVFLAQGNNIPGLWTGYHTITNDNVSTTYTENIVFTTDTVNPQDYETICTFHGAVAIFDQTNGANFGCTCLKQVSAVNCVVDVGTTQDWTTITILIAATTRDDVRMGHFSRIYTPPFTGTINEFLSYPWPGTPSQSDMWANVYLSGLTSTDNFFHLTIANANFDVSSDQIQFDLDITDHDSTNIEVFYSYIVLEDSDLDIEEDLDVNTPEPGLDEINGMTELESTENTGNLRASVNANQNIWFFSIYQVTGLVVKLTITQPPTGYAKKACERSFKFVESPLSDSFQTAAIAKMTPQQKKFAKVKKLKSVCKKKKGNSNNDNNGDFGGNFGSNPFGI